MIIVDFLIAVAVFVLLAFAVSMFIKLVLLFLSGGSDSGL